jgi:hypothetical protein
VRWVATGGCVAATATVRAAKTAKWVQTGECTATVMMIAIATRIPDDTGIADDTVTGAIGTIEAGTARTGAETTGVATTKIGPAVA